MASNNNDDQQNSDQFSVERLIQETAVGNQSRPRRDGQNQSTKNGQAVPIGQSKPNNGKPPPRDGQTATPSTQSSKQVEDLEADAESLQVEIPIPENVDLVTVALLGAVNRTNTLLFEQNKRIIAALEKKRRSRTPPKRRYRHRSSSSSRSPPRRRYRNRSYSPSPRRGSLSPGYKRDLSDSESPRGRKRNSGAASKKTSVSKHKDLSPRKKPASPHKGRGETLKKAGKPSKPRHSPKRPRRYTPSPPESDEERQNPFSKEIVKARISRGMEKPPEMDLYDGTTDPEDHILSVVTMLDYHSVSGAIKCRIFPTTLRGGAMTWYKNLPRNSVRSWAEFKDKFSHHFTASRRHPKTEASLEVIV
ncbi:uncharacterized protein LOC131651084 [Vicia villosa]|uniref:uncharacterized protein LOC131651084 n=1 Tax=Vicia villosa TaxID=3911 RepID=UPI00273A7B3F|nr:uncharacterized protein LOC131651084 [Vicia villosa]